MEQNANQSVGVDDASVFGCVCVLVRGEILWLHQENYSADIVFACVNVRRKA